MMTSGISLKILSASSALIFLAGCSATNQPQPMMDQKCPMMSEGQEANSGMMMKHDEMMKKCMSSCMSMMDSMGTADDQNKSSAPEAKSTKDSDHAKHHPATNN